MTLLTYLSAFAHFSSEILIFCTMEISIPVLSPVIVASAYDFFVNILCDLMVVLSHDLLLNSCFTYMNDLAIRLLCKSMTPTCHMAS